MTPHADETHIKRRACASMNDLADTTHNRTSQPSPVEKALRPREFERHSHHQTETLYRLARSLIHVDGLEQVMRLGVESVGAALAADCVSLATLEAGGERVTALAHSPRCTITHEAEAFLALWGDLARWVMAANEPLAVQSVQPDPREGEREHALRVEARVGAVTVVPLIYHERALGVLLAAQHIDRPPFGEQDTALLATIANQIAAAIQNAHLVTSLEQEKARLELLYRLSRYLSETLDIQAVAQRALDEICSVLNTLWGSLIVGVPGSNGLKLMAVSGYTAERVESLAERLDLHEGDGLAGWVHAHRQSVLLDDVTREPRWLPVAGLDDKVRSVVCVPLIYGEEAVGALSVSSAARGFFNEGHLRLVESTATTVAVAITNARYVQEVKQRAWEQEQVSHIVRALNTLDVKAAFPVLARGTRELTGCQHICLALLTASGERLSVTMLDSPSATLEDGRCIPITAIPAYQAVLHDCAYLIEDDLDAVSEGICYMHGVRSRVSLGLRAGGESIGVLSLGAEVPRTFHPAQIPILQQIADALAIAIEHSRLFRAEQRQRELAERLRDTALLVNNLDFQQVLEAIMEQLESLFPYASGTILLLEDDVMRIIAARNLAPETVGREMPLADFPYNQRLAQGEIVVIADTAQAKGEWVQFEEGAHIRSNIGVPLWVRDRVIGALTIDSDVPHSYDAQDTRLVQAFAQQAALAIENARLFEAERAQRELSEALEEAAAVVSSALDFERVLDHILDQVARVVEGDTFNIMMIEEGMARVVRWRGYEVFDFVDEISSTTVPLEKYPSLVTMVKTGEAVVIPNTSQDPAWISSPTRTWRRSYVAAPIRVAGETVGFLNVNSSRAGCFNAHDARRLQTFADHAAIAIQNAHLYEQQLHYAEQLERRVRERTIQLEARNAWLEAILSSTSEGIIVTDGDGSIVQTNRVAGLWLDQTLSSADVARLRQTVRDLARKAAMHPDTVIELTGMDLELSAAPISGQGTLGPAVVVAVHDVTYLTALDRMKSQFVSNVSHELRTPITAIRLYCSLIKTAPPKRLTQYIRALDQESERLGKLVQDILDISRMEGGRLELEVEPADLNALVSTVVKSHRVLAEAKSQQLIWQAPAESLDIRADSRKFVQVLNNLVENAIHYTPEGGVIRLTTGPQTSEGRAWAVVRIADTGIGISQDEIAQVFERFFRGSQPREMQIQGSGLGLAIAREILELHGGKVTVESQVNVGSTFTVWMPLSPGAEQYQAYFRGVNEW